MNMFKPTGLVWTFDDINRSFYLLLLLFNRSAVQYPGNPKGFNFSPEVINA